MEQFSARPINKAAPSFRNSLTIVMVTEDILSFFSTQEIVHTYGDCAVLYSSDNFYRARSVKVTTYLKSLL